VICIYYKWPLFWKRNPPSKFSRKRGTIIIYFEQLWIIFDKTISDKKRWQKQYASCQKQTISFSSFIIETKAFYKSWNDVIGIKRFCFLTKETLWHLFIYSSNFGIWVTFFGVFIFTCELLFQVTVTLYSMTCQHLYNLSLMHKLKSYKKLL
jgi:hypothetical protein